MRETWLRIDEREDIFASLKLVASCSKLAKSDLTYWKWVIIGTHSTLQGAMALHLGVGNHFLVAKPQDSKSWLAANRDGNPYPEMMMDNFLNLYKKTKSNPVYGYKFNPRSQQDASIEELNYYRNKFTHFLPKGWSIEVSGFPSICLDCLDVVKELNDNSLCYRWQSEEQHQLFVECLSKFRSNLEILKHEYGG